MAEQKKLADEERSIFRGKRGPTEILFDQQETDFFNLKLELQEKPID